MHKFKRFKQIEPHRTFSNYSHTERARYIDFFHTSSGWFDWTEPSPTTSLQGIQGVLNALLREVHTSSNLLELYPHRESKVYRLLSHGFRVVRLHRTSSSLLEPQRHRASKVWRVLSQECGVVRTSSNLLEPQHHRASKVWRVLSQEFGVVSLYRTLQGKQGVQGPYAIVRVVQSGSPLLYLCRYFVRTSSGGSSAAKDFKKRCAGFYALVLGH